MEIVNPMYDASFKYLVEDPECARTFLGELLRMNILHCELLHNEIVTEGLSDSFSGILKMDFKALVQTAQGNQWLVIIEVQKAQRSNDLLRFRQYLGHQYTNKNNTYAGAEGVSIPLPIVAVYLLGYSIGLNNQVPIIHVLPQCFDYTDGTSLPGNSLFVESLSHEMIIVQTKALRRGRRSQLEEFLSNFEPDSQLKLEVDPGNFDEKFLPLLKRLEEAGMRKEIELKLEKALQEKGLAQLEKEKERQEKELAQQEKEIAQQEKEKAQLEKEKERQEREKIQKILITHLLSSGVSIKDIATQLNIPESEIARLRQ
ncbi:MAG: hypothetical protein MUF42_17450 [Cytophagaceae bacterium]|nr:hypothetical protein [Cytophagaceae bacterium]